MTSPMPVVANVLEMPKPRKRQRQVRAKISFMDERQLESFLRAAREGLSAAKRETKVGDRSPKGNNRGVFRLGC